MEKNLQSLAQQSAKDFALSEFSADESTKATIAALGPVKTVPAFKVYAEYSKFWKTAYMAEKECNVGAADRAWSRHYAACTYNAVPKMPEGAKSKETKAREARRAEAKKATADLIAKFTTPEALRDKAAELIKAGNNTLAIQYSTAADILGKKVVSTQEEDRKALRAQIVERVKACHNLETLRHIVTMLPAPVNNIPKTDKAASKAVKKAVKVKAKASTHPLITPVTA